MEEERRIRERRRREEEEWEEEKIIIGVGEGEGGGVVLGDSGVGNLNPARSWRRGGKVNWCRRREKAERRRGG